MKKLLKINDLPDILTKHEVAVILRISLITLYRWEKKGKIKAIRINERGDRRYLKEEVLKILGIKQGNETN